MIADEIEGRDAQHAGVGMSAAVGMLPGTVVVDVAEAVGAQYAKALMKYFAENPTTIDFSG